jgi:hypothetical protein
MIKLFIFFILLLFLHFKISLLSAKLVPIFTPQAWRATLAVAGHFHGRGKRDPPFLLVPKLIVAPFDTDADPNGAKLMRISRQRGSI